jgi:hypothetical protein
MRPSTYTCAAVSTASTALHVYTCSTDLNWANSYMVSNVMDSFTPLTTCVKLQTRSLFWSRLWETSRTLATFTSHDSWYLMNDVTTSDIRKFCEFSFTIFRSAWSFCVNINSQKEKFSRFSRMVIARSLTEQTVFVNTEQRSVGSWLADRIFNMLPGRPPPWNDVTTSDIRGMITESHIHAAAKGLYSCIRRTPTFRLCRGEKKCALYTRIYGTCTVHCTKTVLMDQMVMYTFTFIYVPVHCKLFHHVCTLHCKSAALLHLLFK